MGSLYTLCFDGSNYYGRSYHEKNRAVDPFVTEEDIKRIMAPRDSIRAYYPDVPSKSVEKVGKTFEESLARYIFLLVYKEFPYSFAKKRFKGNFIEGTSSFDAILCFYTDKVKEKCLVFNVSFDTLYGEKDIYKHLTREFNNAKARISRFEKKVFNNKWDYFFTITYDDKKFSNEEDFRKALLITFMNLHNRHGWEFMGCFEKGSENNRLHFHGFVFLNNFVGSFKLVPVEDWSIKHQKIHLHLQSEYFLERFGKNEFASIDFGNNSSDMVAVVKYCTKYILKDSEKFFYSRGIPTFYCFKYEGSSLDIVACDSVFFEGRHYYFDNILDLIDPIRLKE